MKKVSKLIVLTPLIVVAGSSLTSCNKTNSLTLRILNSEDYIYLGDPNDPSDKDLVDQFVDYIEANYPQYHGVNIVYDTSDTNETIYSEIQTGKSNYDLMNVSEYMAQKIVAGGFAVKIDREKIPNYDTFASKEIVKRLDEITATQKVYDPASGKYVDQVVELKDYAIGYMWGTLGSLVNPTFKSFVSSNISFDDVIYDMQSFDMFWDTKYHGSISIKNSMRDTYALGLLHTYEDEFVALKNQYEKGEITSEEYQKQFSTIFNRSDAKSVEEIRLSLEELKNNIFGLEVDSGKQDIVTKKIGINLAWSGDAVYAMDQGDEVGTELYYAVPEIGSNIWNDVWIMPNCERSSAQNELAHLFLDFLCDPSVASQNMDYTGYTSYVGGDDILELVRDYYDYRTDEIFETVLVDEEEISAQVYSVNEEDFAAIDYPDFLMATHDASKDAEELRYFLPYETEEGEIIEEPIDLADLLAHGDTVKLTDENEEPTDVVKTYGDLTIVDSEDSEIEAVDLSYFFNGTLYQTAEDKYGDDLAEMLENGIEPVLYEEGVDTIFYSDCYLPFYYEDENGNEVHNVSVGRQFFCQYPSEETILRCAVMEDYGENNTNVMKMWENFKSDPLPLWATIVFFVFLIAIVAVIAYFVYNKVAVNKVRKQRVVK